MRTSFVLASVLSLVGSVLGSCPDASRYGNTNVSPGIGAPLKGGDTITITTNYTCADYYDIKPVYTDYFIVGRNQSVTVPDLWLARRDNTPTVDTFTATIPHWFTYNANAEYNLFAKLIYPINGTDGSPVYITGGQDWPLNITSF